MSWQRDQWRNNLLVICMRTGNLAPRHLNFGNLCPSHHAHGCCCQCNAHRSTRSVFFRRKSLPAGPLSTVKIVYEVTTGCTNSWCHDCAQLAGLYNKCVYLDYAATSTRLLLLSLHIPTSSWCGPAGNQSSLGIFVTVRVARCWVGVGPPGSGRVLSREPHRPTTNAVLLLSEPLSL